MAVALVVFWAGRRRYVNVPPSGADPHSFARVLWSAARRPAAPGGGWLDRARPDHPAAAVDGARAVLRVAGVFAATLAFWALFDQQGSSWILQAQRMDGTLFGGVRLEASQIPALNPLLVLTGVPLLHRVVFPALERLGVRVTPLGRMTVGMFLATTSFAAAGLVEAALDGGARLHVAWQLPQYLTITAAEILVSVTALEFAYTQAPKALKSTVMSVWFLTSALGNLLTATVSQVNRFQGPTFFWFFAALMLGAAVLFALVARAYRPVASVVAGVDA
jgi:POT family proton-dependent oligopeptide transporter